METNGFRDARSIHVGARFEVFRAVRLGDEAPVVIRAARRDGATAQAESGELLRHEYDLLRRLDVAQAARPLGFQSYEGRPALVLADAGPRDLSESLQGRAMQLGEFLDAALEMAEIVGAIHRRSVIHRDICPSNFVVGERLTLVDFEAATPVSGFAPAAGAPRDLPGTIAYIAPEQTGRVKRLVDHRADLYSLGCTYYEMLTGAPPFSAPSPLELVHLHVARRALAPAAVHPGVPPAVSEIVEKLLAKMPERRYQTAEALAADLEEARRRWRERGDIGRFELGLLDLPHGLVRPGRLYARERERLALEQAVERIAGGGREVIVVTGRAGVGKSALVRELMDGVEGRCRCLVGKCDLLRGHVPYGPVAAALGGLASALFDRPDEEVSALRAALAEAVAPNGRVLVDLVPELDRLLGEPAPVADVGAVEAENRFHLAFAAFVRALAAHGPTLLFLDDLQWADAASLKLLRTLAVDADIHGLLLIAAYRADEVDAARPIDRTLAAVRAAGTPVATLELRPLDEPALAAMLADALRADAGRASPLAREVLRKTAGNPFFVRRFIGHLFRERLLVFDADRKTWSWDLDAIAEMEVAENVVELAAASIRSLPEATQEVLRTAACIGNQFDLALLAALGGKPQDEVAQLLWSPLEEGLIVPAGGPRFGWAAHPVELRAARAPSYRFAHDRIQQAAYRLLDADERTAIHLRVGRELLRMAAKEPLGEDLFTIVDQLDRAPDRLPGPQRTWLADLNRQAGDRARLTSAFGSAWAYFAQGLALLPDEPWRTHHALWFQLQRGAAESAALCADLQASERLVEEGLVHAETRLEKAGLHDLAVVASTTGGRFESALRHGVEALLLLGMDLPADRPEQALEAEKARARALLGNRSWDQLLEAPPLGDAEHRARLQLLVDLSAPAWYASDALFKLVSLRAAQESLERGHTPASPMAYGSWAVALAMDGEYEAAYDVGRFAVRLAERLEVPAQECRVLMTLGGHVSPWRAPLRDSVPLLRRSMAVGVQSGELLFAAIAGGDLVCVLFSLGAELDQVIAECDSVLAWDRKIGHAFGAAHVLPPRQAARCLKGVTRRVGSFDDDSFDEAGYLAGLAGNPLAVCGYHHFRAQVCYLLGDLAAASASLEAAAPLLPVLRSLFLSADHAFYACLILAALADAAAPTERPPLVARMRAAVERVTAWAAHAPSTWVHKRDLMAVELARLEDRGKDALVLYVQAIEGARREGVVRDEALAHERCGAFHLGRGEDATAGLHLAAALDGYARWGASGKVRLLQGAQGRSPPAAASRRASGGASEAALDEQSLLKVAEALTSELVLDRLVEKLVVLCGEAASAGRTVLVLDRGGLVVHATAEVGGEVTIERQPLARSGGVPAALVEHAHATGEVVHLGDALAGERFTGEPYLRAHQVRSVLALPLRRGPRRVGVLYFENRLVPDAFPPERLQTLRLLSGGSRSRSRTACSSTSKLAPRRRAACSRTPAVRSPSRSTTRPRWPGSRGCSSRSCATGAPSTCSRTGSWPRPRAPTPTRPWRRSCASGARAGTSRRIPPTRPPGRSGRGLACTSRN